MIVGAPESLELYGVLHTTEDGPVLENGLGKVSLCEALAPYAYRKVRIDAFVGFQRVDHRVVDELGYVVRNDGRLRSRHHPRTDWQPGVGERRWSNPTFPRSESLEGEDVHLEIELMDAHRTDIITFWDTFVPPEDTARGPVLTADGESIDQAMLGLVGDDPDWLSAGAVMLLPNNAVRVSSALKVVRNGPCHLRDGGTDNSMPIAEAIDTRAGWWSAPCGLLFEASRAR